MVGEPQVHCILFSGYCKWSLTLSFSDSICSRTILSKIQLVKLVLDGKKKSMSEISFYLIMILAPWFWK